MTGMVPNNTSQPDYPPGNGVGQAEHKHQKHQRDRSRQ